MCLFVLHGFGALIAGSGPNVCRQVANTVALMEAHLSGLRSIRTRYAELNAVPQHPLHLNITCSLEKVRPKVPQDLTDACSNAVASARELKSAASFIFKADSTLIAKVPPRRACSRCLILKLVRWLPLRRARTPTRPSALFQGALAARGAARRGTSRARRYSLFVKESSAGIRAATPGMNAVDVMKACGAKWQSLTPEAKAEWNSKCKQQ
jgi:hypothetical protein